MKIVFLGTADFAIPCLEAVQAAGHTILGVVTQPDRPKGRGQQLQESPFKQRAKALGFKVLQPESAKETALLEELRSLEPELLCVVAYGQILPEALLQLPSRMAINVHASLLPKYRGAAPIEWAIANGESETGISVQRMVKRLDAGEVLLSERLAIGEDDGPALTERLAQVGAALLPKAIRLAGEAKPALQAQDEAQASYAPLLQKKDGALDFSLKAPRVLQRFRAFHQRPGSFTAYQKETCRIHALELGPDAAGAPFRIAKVAGEGLQVFCGEGSSLWIKTLQSPGAKALPGEAWANGKRLKAGQQFEMPFFD